ncbi:hypothetical protein NPIL_250921 [Nephila pilipes]|uniref:Uncharacterized protein n=1 Tax=Nephila pilipes TaxID=299642 RepID=A0A8X6TZG4_NEPPI|nr:hypothetical protein NPIL_250921 [Nephila pilipes]
MDVKFLQPNSETPGSVLEYARLSTVVRMPSQQTVDICNIVPFYLNYFPVDVFKDADGRPHRDAQPAAQESTDVAEELLRLKGRT